MRVQNAVEVRRRDFSDGGKTRLDLVPRPRAYRLLEGYREVERLVLGVAGGEQKRVVFQDGETYIVAVFVRGWLAVMEVNA
ncbi:MAG: hypothetical protein GYA21_12430 [Myxococcales bacterium]|nr:hypothetical protein [Myxococcales bacterium]